LLNVLNSDDVLITQCFFRGANYNLIGGTVNACVVQECDFGSYGSYAVNFTNASGMTFQGCAFEPDATGAKAGAITGTYTGLNVIGCWMGDVVTTSGSPTSNWMAVQGYAINVSGNYFNGDGYHLITPILITGVTYGINVNGNYFSAFPTCLNLGTGYSHDVVFLTNSTRANTDAFVTGTVAGGTALIQNWVYAISSPQLDLTGSLALTGSLLPGGTTCIWTSGAGTPQGSVTAPVGSLYTRTDGGASTTLYVKESGTGNTGWVAK
jgi:hypothetical protein